MSTSPCIILKHITKSLIRRLCSSDCKLRLMPLQKYLMWLPCVSHIQGSNNTCEFQIPCVSHVNIFTCEMSHYECFTCEMSHLNAFHMWNFTWDWNFTCETSHVKSHVKGHMWNFTCEISHGKSHMWNFTCETSHVKSRMWNFTWEVTRENSHVKFHMGNSTCEISYVKFHIWYFPCEISHVKSPVKHSAWEYFFHIWFLKQAVNIVQSRRTSTILCKIGFNIQEPRQWHSDQGRSRSLIPQSGMICQPDWRILLWAKTLSENCLKHFYLIDDRYIWAFAVYINLRGEMFAMKWNEMKLAKTLA